MIRLRFAIAALLALSAAMTSAEDNAAVKAEKIAPEQLQFFEAKIRPIFVQHCYQCHSEESGDDLEGGLFLDSRWGWSTGGDSGPAITPGKVDDSLIIHAVRYEEDVVSAMPPKSKLSKKNIELLEKWVSMGAPDPRAKPAGATKPMAEAFDLQQRFQEHWSWRPIQNPKPPTVKDTAWPQTELDRFVLAKLESAGIKPAESADRETWIRRVYFDVIGLPPTIEQVDAFLKDDSSDARATVVEGLLNSPHFGEKWARHWMDLVRYAESYGHEFDYPLNHAHQYRDYLIRAFNADVPYDQFIREHLAGDLIDQPRTHPTDQYNESVIGTGFWYLHEATHAPTDVLTNEADIIDNQLDVFGKSFLGLTVACARCHDHKFDAISTADYYALSAYIQSSCRQLAPLDPKGKITQSVKRLRDLQVAHYDAWAEATIDPAAYFDATRDLVSRAATEKIGVLDKEHFPRPESAWVNEAATGGSMNADILNRWIDLVCRSAPKDKGDVASLIASRIKSPESAKRMSELVKATKTKRQQYAESNTLFQDFALGQLPDGWTTSGQAFQPVSRIHDSTTPMPIEYRSQPGSVDSGVYGKRAAGTLRSPTFKVQHDRIHVRMRASENAQVRLVVDNYQMAEFNGLLFNGTFLKGKSTDTAGNWQWKSLAGNLNKYKGHNAYLEFVDNGDATIAVDEIWFTNSGPPPHSNAAASELAAEDSATKAFRKASKDFLSGQRSSLIEWLIDNDLIPAANVTPKAQACIDQAKKVAAEMSSPMIAIAMADGTRENAHVYVRGSSTMLGEKVPPRTLEALGGQTGDRLELANRIASLQNPLAARVMANRIWHHLFGAGIVPTVDDFGPQGQPATHPELLDYLATDFATNHWSIKELIQKIVLSRTYGQSSVVNKDNDPDLIATADPTNALLHRMRIRRLPAESIRDGILAISGRLDRKQFGPSVKTHRTEFMTGRGARGSGPLDGAGRRSVYLSIYRNFLNPFLLSFDMPSPFGPKGRRSNSNVPAQALTLMNDPFVLEQAKLWAKNTSAQKGRRNRIRQMVRTAHGASPSASELERLDEFVASHEGNQQQAWADLAHALLNMKSFYFLK